MADVGTLAAELRTAAVRLLERAREQNRQMQYSGPKDVELERLMEKIVEHLDAHRFSLWALLDDSDQLLKLKSRVGPTLEKEAHKLNSLFKGFLRVFIPEAIRQEIRDAGGIRAYLKRLRSEALELKRQADEYSPTHGLDDITRMLGDIADLLDEEDPAAIDVKKLRSENSFLSYTLMDGVEMHLEKSNLGTFAGQLRDFAFRLGEVLEVIREEEAARR